MLFHGGFFDLTLNQNFVTNKPLSTSISPLVAFMNAIHKGKAFYSKELHLLVLSVKNPSTNIFCFNNRGSLSHEKEILFSGGATLTLRNKIFVKNGEVSVYVAGKLNEKVIPFYILEVDIS